MGQTPGSSVGAKGSRWEDVCSWWYRLNCVERNVNKVLTFKKTYLFFYMCLRIINPKPTPRKVAIAIPKMPARILGTTKDLQPLAVAIPHAVVGPPILAFEAKSNSFKSILNSFPKQRIIARWTVTWTKANMKILGVLLMTYHILPLAPTTAKNTCSSHIK